MIQCMQWALPHFWNSTLQRIQEATDIDKDTINQYTISKLNICMENIRIKLSLKDQKYLLGG